MENILFYLEIERSISRQRINEDHKPENKKKK